jgi:hypothetical protein
MGRGAPSSGSGRHEAKALSVKSVSSVVIPEIVRRVEGLFALADQLEVRLAKARGQVEKLTPSLPPSPGYGGTGLARAFAGKLVPQDPQ